MAEVNIIAIGGGGVTNGTDPAMDIALLNFCGLAAQRIGLVGTASGNDPGKIARFQAGFSGLAAKCRILPIDADARQARAWAHGLDLIYIGGGDTLLLMRTWRQTSLHEALLAAAAEEGCVLAGVSAGAMCWFEAMLTDTTGRLAPMAGLGILPGSCTAHARQDALRLPAFRDLIGRGLMPDGLALDDGVAVLCRRHAPPRLLSAREGAAARIIRREGQGVVETCLTEMNRNMAD